MNIYKIMWGGTLAEGFAIGANAILSKIEQYYEECEILKHKIIL